jgi:AcrR family transcriptional regulator
MTRQNQIDFSKKTISEAFCLLIKKYKFEEITISQITAEAGVSRSTFYRHFDTVESVVEYTNDSVAEEGLAMLSALESPTLADLIHWRLKIAKELPYLNDLELHPAIKSILATVSPERLRKFSEVLDFKTPYKLTFNEAGFQAVISQWAKTGFRESVDEMTTIILRLTES